MNLKQKIGLKIIFGKAFPYFFRFSRFLQYLVDVIQNNNFNGLMNGEYWFRDKFLECSVYIDIGYNKGEWSKYISNKNKNSKIFAFDPCKDVVKNFDKEKDSYSNIFLEQLAVSNKEGFLEFFDYGEMNGCNSLSKRDMDFSDSIKPITYNVKLTSLDKWYFDKNIKNIDFLKIDAEGEELNILEGASYLLENQMIDIILFEYSTAWLCSGRLLKEADTLFKSKPYKVFKLFNNFIAPFQYKTRDEGSMFSMFVAISKNKLEDKKIKSIIRNINLF